MSHGVTTGATVVAPQVPAPTRRKAFIDSDVHPYIRGGVFQGLRPYLSSDWQNYFAAYRKSDPLPTVRFGTALRSGFAADTMGPDGAAPGTDAEHTARQLLDTHGVAAAILLAQENGRFPLLGGVDEGVVLCSALNDYMVENWLAVDSRYMLAIGVPPRDPQAAVAEIRRLSGHRQVVAIFMPLINRLMGDRYFHPIYEVAQELDLPIMLHLGGGEAEQTGSPQVAGGTPSFVIEQKCMLPQIAQSNMISLIFEGTFERFPRLKVVFVEWGFSWLPSVMWRMDRYWRSARWETPWVKKLPSQYVIDHLRFTTQPVDEPARPEHFNQILGMARAGDTLLFATDYPHWDNEFPDRVLTSIPDDIRDRILFENALDTFSRLKVHLKKADFASM